MNPDPKRWLSDPSIQSELRDWLTQEAPSDALPAHVQNKVQRRLAASVLALPVSLNAASLAHSATATSGASTGVGATSAGTTAANASAASASAASASASISSVATGSAASASGAAALTTSASAGLGLAGASALGTGGSIFGALSGAKLLAAASLLVAAGTSTGYLVSHANGSRPQAVSARAPGPTDPATANPANADLLVKSGKPKAELRDSSPQEEATRAEAPRGEMTAAAELHGISAGDAPSGLDLSQLTEVNPSEVADEDDGRTPSGRRNPRLGRAAGASDASPSVDTTESGQQALLREEVLLLKRARAALAEDPQQAQKLLFLYHQRFPTGSLAAEYEALLARLPKAP